MSLAPSPRQSNEQQIHLPQGNHQTSGSLNSGPLDDGETTGRSRLWWIVGAGALLLVAAGGAYFMFGGPSKGDRPDLLTHTVKHENMDLTVVERGNLESANNQDIICHVKAGSKGNFSTTIRWIIDDGSLVTKGQPIMILDSSALEDQRRSQRIELDKALADLTDAEQKYKIQISLNDSEIEKAKVAISLSELDLEKYVGIPKGTISGQPTREGARALLTEMEGNLESFLSRHRDKFSGSDGEFQKSLDEWSGKISLAEGDVEMWKDRVAYSQRMQLKGFLSPSQVQSDESKSAAARETLKQYKAEKKLLQTFSSAKSVKEFSSKAQEAWRAYDRTLTEANAKEIQAESERRTKRSVFIQQEEKLRDIEEQLLECRIQAPQDGMVVYYIPESSRWSSSERGLVQQGASVQEGQKLMRIPDLKKMQVTTRVHEAMVSRIRGDDRRTTGVHESVRAGLLLSMSPIQGLFSQQESILELHRAGYRNREYRETSRGQNAIIRVDAFPERPLKGHVRTVATVASSSDFMTSDVKVYSTVVAIDDPVEGLKPGMSAEVTIHVSNTLENVLTVPIQSIVGGAEGGRTRKVYIMTAKGPEEKEIEIGLSNEKMAEVRSGLEVGDRVVVNPKAIVGNSSKTREDTPETKASKGYGGGGMGKGKGKGGGAPGGAMPGGGGGAPGGGVPPGGGGGKGTSAKG